VLGLPLQEIDEGWNDPRIRGLLERALKRVPREDNVDVDVNFPILGRRRIMLRARRIDRPPEPPYILLVARYTDGGEA
jgi:hypothetical protein